MGMMNWAVDAFLKRFIALPRDERAELLASTMEALVRGMPPADLVEISRVVVPRVMEAMASTMSAEDKGAMVKSFMAPEMVEKVLKDALPGMMQAAMASMSADQRRGMLAGFMPVPAESAPSPSRPAAPSPTEAMGGAMGMFNPFGGKR